MPHWDNDKQVFISHNRNSLEYKICFYKHTYVLISKVTMCITTTSKIQLEQWVNDHHRDKQCIWANTQGKKKRKKKAYQKSLVKNLI